MARYYRMRIDDSKAPPEFSDIPSWLRPYLYQLNQMGCREDRLRSIFQHLPHQFLSVLRTACTTIAISALQRIEHARAYNEYDRLPNRADSLEDEQWLYEGMGLSDDELDTYDSADFGVLR